MAEHITDEHGGSSIAKVTARNSLRNKLSNIWRQVKSKSNDLASGLDCIPPLKYTSISLPREAKLFLLICSMFPDDFRIPIDNVVTYGMGIELFEDVHDMFAARRRVHDIISIINDTEYPRKASGPKIRVAYGKDGPTNQYVEMLDGARDLATLIASEYPLFFHHEIVIEKWPGSTERCIDSYGLSLVFKKFNKKPIYWDLPKLTLLQLQCKEHLQSIGIDIFERMKGLWVLSLDVPSLPQSLKVLRNLRTLSIKVPKSENMSWIGCLINLKFLTISISDLTDIPVEMGKLENLMLLDLRKTNIAYIPPGVFARLLKLEELYLPLSFSRWGCKAKKYEYAEWDLGEGDNYDDGICEIDDGERINTSLAEVLSHSLNALQVSLPKASTFPKKSLAFKNIREFKIVTPNKVKYKPFGKPSKNELQLTGEAHYIEESGICDLMGRTEDISLIGVRNLKNVIFQLQDGGFPELKKMIISECDELEYVVDTTSKRYLSTGDYLFWKLECLHLSMLSNLKGICHGKWENFQWFQNLSQMSIRFCPKLKYVLPVSIVRGSNLKSIEILDCHEMEGIFCEDEPFTLFCSIEKLDLHSLPRLISLLVHNDNIDKVRDDINKSLTANEVSVIKNKEAFSHMKTYSAFPSSLVGKWFHNLKILKIAFCDVKVVFLFVENPATSEVFNSLEALELHGLQNLVHIWFRIPPRITAFKNLQLLVLSRCNNSYVFSSRVARLLVQLQKVYISRCKKMEKIIMEDDESDKKIVFPQLKLMELQHIRNLRFFSGGTCEIELPLLQYLKFYQCNMLESFSNGFLRTPKLEGVELNGSLYLLKEDLNVVVKRVTSPHRITLADLEIATKDFSLDNFLGEGTFGSVYKGWIDKRTFTPSKTSIRIPVAVKRIFHRTTWELFYNDIGLTARKLDVNFVGRLSHPNVVKLLGHCFEDEAVFLVFEFVERGSLDKHLFIRNPGIKPLSWDMRIKIAIGVAEGLDFLHTTIRQVIHGDIKSSHILLDSDYNAKLSHFDLTILDPPIGKSHIPIDSKGSFGSTDPMYGRKGVKSDVYCFGVVLLELMTGSRAIDSSRPKGQLHLAYWLNSALPTEGELRNMMDSRMQGQYSSKAMLITANLASKCTQDDHERRPTMGEVLRELEEIEAIKDQDKD